MLIYTNKLFSHCMSFILFSKKKCIQFLEIEYTFFAIKVQEIIF